MPLHDYDQQTRVELQEEITKLCGECAEFKFQLSDTRGELDRLRKRVLSIAMGLGDFNLSRTDASEQLKAALKPLTGEA